VGLQSGSTNDQRSCRIYKHAYLCLGAEMQDQSPKERIERDSRIRKKTPIVTPVKNPMKKILVASFGLLVSFALLRRRRVQLWMASPEVDEQCIFSSKCRRASWLPATDMPSTTGPAARVMLFHVAVQVPLRVLSCKGGAVCASQAA